MKRLVYCFDGTWNDDTGNAPLTNVVKLHRAVAPVDAAGVRQVSRYIVGIATDLTGRRKFWAGALGVEVGRRVLAAYRRLALDYEVGDEIYLFGFSRGAYEARSLASFIALVGLGRESEGFSIDQAWTLYRRHRAAPDHVELQAIRANAQFPLRIACVGVWDTVGNLGNPFVPDGPVTRKLNFHDARLPDIVDVGLHALSIDETRGPFSPALWSLRKGAMLPAGQRVEQVWFAGSHADIGGGFKETGLSDIALMWMAEAVMRATPLALDHDLLAREARPEPLGIQHAAATGRIYGWTRMLPFIRFINQDRRALSLIRWAALGYWRTNRLPPGESALNESVHPSALRRFGKTVSEKRYEGTREIVYRPRNLLVAREAAEPGAAEREIAGS